MTTFLTVIHVLSCILLVFAVLIQSGKGAEMSASFAGSSQTVFGSSGGANFITRFTSIVATVFMLSSLSLTLLSSRSSSSMMDAYKSKPKAGAAAPANTTSAPAAAPAQSAPAPAESPKK